MSSLSPGGASDPFLEQRLRALGIGIALVFALFVVRLFQLQVVEGEQHLQNSLRNSIRTLRLAAPRGEIVDREGRLIAGTRPAFDLDVVPSELRDSGRTLTVLSALLESPPARLRSALGEPRGRARFQPVRLADDLGWEPLARVESHRYALPGVLTEVRPQRTYPNGPLAAHLIGMLGEVRPEQLENEAGPFASYRAGDVIGQSGVEASLESQLRGHAGGRNVLVDVAGREVEVLDRIEPSAGGRVTLALDLDLQRAAEQGLLATAQPGDPVAGAVVALDPRNGDLLAMVSMPAFDPNAFSGTVDPVTWHALTHDPERPLQNRALAGQYPPGSTWKPIVAAAALQEHVRTPSTTVFCPGSFAFGNRSYRCWRKEGHGTVDLHRAIMQSCDVYFYRTGLELGIDRLAHYASGFGLGQRTGIALDGEKSGVVPSSDWKLRRFGEPWMAGETVSASIGQGYDLVTPLQLAVAYAAIANGGDVVRPRVVLEVEDPSGAKIPQQTEVASHAPVDPEHLARVRDGLRAVVEAPSGTGHHAQVRGLAVAGKTGTAQVVKLEHTEGLKGKAIPWKYRDHAWFVSFAPVDDPQIVVAVLVEHGGHGGSAAAPVAQQVLARWFEKHAAPPPDQRVAAEPSVDAGPTAAAPSAAAIAAAPDEAAAPGDAHDED